MNPAGLHPTQTSDQVARAVVRRVRHGRGLVVGSAGVRLTLLNHRLARWAVDRLVVVTGRRALRAGRIRHPFDTGDPSVDGPLGGCSIMEVAPATTWGVRP